MRLARTSVVAATLLVGCSHSATNPTYEGIYTFGVEVETFTPCGDEKDYWVIADEQIWRQLRDETMRLTSKPYEGIYIKISGEHAGNTADADGFASEYDGLFRISRVWLTRAQSNSDCGR